MKAERQHCAPDRIDAFLRGDLSEAEVAELEQHLESCEVCDKELTEKTADETFWTDAREFLSSVEDLQQAIDTADRTRPHAKETAVTAPGQFTGKTTFADAKDYLSFLDPTDDPDMLGRFGGYEISGIIGSGGMGVVMKGWDRSLDRFVAIKVLHSNYAGQSAPRKRFAREAQAAAAVLHDNVIAIYGVDEWKGMPFLVMPYIKGESLQQRVDRRAPLSLEEILGIGLQIARGLAAAHDQGLVHRDIKPANILMPSSVSRVIITDFGLARTADDASLTRSGVLAGTPQYMSPEQAKGDAIDGRTDLFSLGSVMYAMACGRPPFRAETPYGVLRKITDEPHRPISQVGEGIPMWFERLVDRLLEKVPDDRFGNANDVAEYLEDALAHLRQPTTTILPVLDPSVKQRRRSAKRFRSAAAVAALLTVLAYVAFSFVRNVDPNADRSNASTTQSFGAIPNGSEPSARGDAIVRDESPGDDASGDDAPGDDAPADGVGSLPYLRWRYDERPLERLETDLQILLNETKKNTP